MPITYILAAALALVAVAPAHAADDRDRETINQIVRQRAYFQCMGAIERNLPDSQMAITDPKTYEQIAKNLTERVTRTCSVILDGRH